MGERVSTVGVSHQMEIPQEPGTVPCSNWAQKRGTAGSAPVAFWNVETWTSELQRPQ